MYRLITATAEAAVSTEFGLPPLFWSPDADLTRGTTVVNGATVVNDYPGRALAAREFTLVLHAAPGEDLPADAEARLEVFTGTDESGTATYEAIRSLTPSHKTLIWRGPVERMRVRKNASDGHAYGVVAFGLLEPTAQTTT